MRKNIVYYVTAQYMKINKKRTFTTFLGIVFMVLLMTCVFVGKDTAIDYMQQIGSLKEGKWHVALFDITKKEQKEVERLAEVERTAISANYGITEFAQSANENRPYLNVKSYQKECFDWMNIKLKSGRLPENAKEVVLSDAVLADGASITVGDKVKAEYFTRSITGIDKEVFTDLPFYNIYNLGYGQTVDVPQDFPYYGKNTSFKENRDYLGKKQQLTVVGIMEIPNYESEKAAAYTAITMLDEKEIQELDRFNLSVMLDLEEASDSYELALQEIVGEGEIEYNNYVLAFSGQSSSATINVMVFFLTIFFVIFIMFASILLIYNVFNMSFEERSHYLGMLSSVGATGRQKRSSIYYEVFSLLIVALPTGIFCGFGVIKLGMMAIQPFFGKIMGLEEYIKDTNITLMIAWKAMGAIVIVSIVTVLVSAYFPARKIGKIGSIESIRGNINKKSRQYKMNKFMVQHGNAEGLLARNALKRQSKKTKSITAATVTFMVILVVTAFGGSAIKKAVEKIMGNYDLEIKADDWDWVLSADSGEKYESMKQGIEQTEGIAKTKEWYSGMFVGSVPMDCYSKEYWKDIHDIYNLYYHKKLSDQEFNKIITETQPICVVGVETETLKEIAEATGSDLKTLENTNKPAAIVMQEGEVSTDNTRIVGKEPEKYRFYDVKQMTDKKIGESLSVEICSEKEITSFPIQVAGYANSKQLKDMISFHSQYLWLIVNIETAKEIARIQAGDVGEEHLEADLYIKTTENNSVISKKLLELSESSGGEYILSRVGYQAEFKDAIVGIVYVMLTGFVVLTSVICMMNLFNSIHSRVNERTREFATMKSVGMTKKQIEKMLFYENMGIVTKSILYAGLIAFPLMFVIQYGIIEIFGSMTLRFPWALMAAVVLIIILTMVTLTKYCYRKEKYENIMERIRNESI